MIMKKKDFEGVVLDIHSGYGYKLPSSTKDGYKYSFWTGIFAFNQGVLEGWLKNVMAGDILF